MNLDNINKLLLESAGVGLALLDPDRFDILMSNRRFEEWFPDSIGVGKSVDQVLADVDLEKLRAKLSADKPYTFETSFQMKRRSINLAVTCSRHTHNDAAVVIMECQNISKMKELEYMIESYSKMIEKQNRVLQREKERTEKLLLNLMPKSVYQELKTFGVTTPQRYDDASIFMLDFVGFTDMTIAQDPAGLISELNDIFTAFDRIAEQFGCERIKTMGDAYMAVSGIPEANPEHALNIARFAVLTLRYIKRRNSVHSQKWLCRIGINSGPVIGSIVGVQKYVYDIFGPGVNLAARMETLSEPEEITLCEDMYHLIKNDFHFTERGEIEVKGFGKKQIFTLDGARSVIQMSNDDMIDNLPI